jgi:hypothetical protein
MKSGKVPAKLCNLSCLLMHRGITEVLEVEAFAQQGEEKHKISLFSLGRSSWA